MPWTKKDVDSHIKGLTDKQKSVWVKVANDALKRCEEEDGEDCDASAIKQANAAAKKAKEERMAGMKPVGNLMHERDDFLVLGDKEDPGTWRLPVKEKGKSNPRLMSAAWSHLHKGWRDNKYEGADRMKAIRKLDKLYKDGDVEPPSDGHAALACAEIELERAYAELELNRLGLYGIISEVDAAFLAAYPQLGSNEWPPYYVKDIYLAHPEWGDVLVAAEWGQSHRMFLVPFKVGDEITFALPPWQEVRPSYIKLEIPEETVATETIELAESDLGRIVGIVGEAEAGTAPLVVDIIPISPGWGNTRDNNYYPLETLVEFAPVWKGAKMYVTDHVEGEKSVRTEVSQILESPSGYTNDGVPLARAGIFNEEFAQQVRNRADLGILDGLHNSIQASGTAETGFELDGRKGQRVVAFDGEGANIDWVTQAGAGGQALRIVEGKTEGTMPEDTEKKKQEELAAAEKAAAEKKAAEKAAAEQAAKGKSVRIVEDAPKPDPETPPEAGLKPERVEELVEASNLPEKAKERVKAVGASDEAELQKLIDAEIEYVKALTGSGKPNMPPTQSTEKDRVSTEEMEARLSKVNQKWLGTRVPAGGKK